MIDPRPNPRDPAIIRATAERLYLRVARWLRDAGETDAEDDSNWESIIGDLVHAIEDDSHDDRYDGFKITKNLCDRHHWAGDSYLAIILSDVDSIAFDLACTAIKAWVAKNDIQPTHAIGDRVYFFKHPYFSEPSHFYKNSCFSHHPRERSIGKIVGYCRDRGCYTIQKEGQFYPGPSKVTRADGTVSELVFGYTIAYENVSNIESVVPA